jgi:hypothetical protein
VTSNEFISASLKFSSNLKTGKALGLVLAATVLARGEEAIES